MGTVRDLLNNGKEINLMAPMGFICLPQEKVIALISAKTGERPEIYRHAGCSGTLTSVDTDEVLNLCLVDGGYNEKTDSYDYIVAV